MITLTSNEQAKKLIKDGVLSVDDDIEIAFDGFFIEADIKCKNIYSKDYKRDIDCYDIDCYNINCYNIDCYDIDCYNINCCNIEYYAFVIAYQSFKCKSAVGERKGSFHKCLDREIKYIEYIEDEKVNIEISKEDLERLKTILNI